jgi:nucleoside 2-deoxyribosyltransferase
MEDIRQADVLLANVWKLSAGTSMEISFAKSLGKIVVVLVPDRSFFTDIWIKYHSDYVTTSFADAFDYIETTNKQ